MSFDHRLLLDVGHQLPLRPLRGVLAEHVEPGLCPFQRHGLAEDGLLGLVEPVVDVELGGDVGGRRRPLHRGQGVVHPLSGATGTLQPRVGLLNGRPGHGDRPPERLVLLLEGAVGVLAEGQLGGLAGEPGVLVVGLGLADGDPLVREIVLERGRVELAHLMALLDPRALGKEEDDRGHSLDVRQDVIGPHRLDRPPLGHGHAELAGLDLDGRQVVDADGPGLRLGSRPAARRLGERDDAGGHPEGHGQGGGGLHPSCDRHGSEDLPGEWRGRSPADRPGRGESDDGAGRRFDQRRRKQHVDPAWPQRGDDHAEFRAESSAAEAVAEDLPGPGQSRLDRPDRPAQMTGGMLVGARPEVAEDHGGPIPLGEPAQLLVERPDQFVVDPGAGLPRLPRRDPLVPTPPGDGRPEADRGPVGHLMEPGAEGIPDPEGAGPPDQDQERGLEGILRVTRLDQDAPADPEDHRPMPLHQGREGPLGRVPPAGREPLQELAIGQVADHPQGEQRADLAEDFPILSDRHGRNSPPARPPPKTLVM